MMHKGHFWICNCNFCIVCQKWTDMISLVSMPTCHTQETMSCSFWERKCWLIRQLNKLFVGDWSVEVHSAEKDLDVWPDNILNATKFISDRCRIAFLKRYNMQIKSASQITCVTYQRPGTIVSRLQQCFAIWTCRYDHNTDAKSQNSAASLILALSKSKHFNPALQELDWLPIRYRLQFKIIRTLVYKAILCGPRTYTCDLIELKQLKHS